MPNKPLKPCIYPLCGKLVTSAYCDEHSKYKCQSQKDYDKYHRDKESKSFYTSSAWLKCSEAILVRDNYLCQICLQKGMLEPATLVHHKKPLKINKELALAEENLISLCDSCHNKEHGNGRR